MTERADLFIDKLVVMPNGCWKWEGAICADGYGRFGRTGEGRSVLAHRVSYELFVGAIPTGLTLDHLCRNRACVNPGHLEPVTTRENVLRGEGVTAKNARKTHCHRGHPLVVGNIYRAPKRGVRECLTCRRERDSGRA